MEFLLDCGVGVVCEVGHQRMEISDKLGPLTPLNICTRPLNHTGVNGPSALGRERLWLRTSQSA